MNLNKFYNHSRGKMVKRLLRVLVKDWWPQISDLRCLSVGLSSSSNQLLNAQNVKTATNIDTIFTQKTRSADRIFILHALEHVNDANEFLSEIYRILDSEGRAIFIVPNRHGFWSRAEHTPFGQGTPYSMTQLKQALIKTGFSIERDDRALYAPPGRSRILIYLAPLFERLGCLFCPALGGVLMIEVSKNLLSGHLINSPPPKRAPSEYKPGHAYIKKP